MESEEKQVPIQKGDDANYLYSHPHDDDDDDLHDDDDENFDMCEDTEPGEIRTDPDFPVCAYTILNVLIIVWGIVGLLMTMGHRTHKLIDEFLQVDKRSLNLPPYFLFASCSVSILSGVLALIFLLAESASFFSVYPHVNGLIGGLNAMACLCAVGASSEPNVHKYQRLLEADSCSRIEVSHHHHHEYDHDDQMTYGQLLGNEYKNYWDRLQTALHCCGLEGPHNWIKSVCQCIPTSCCDEGKKDECLKRVLEWTNPEDPQYHNFSHVASHLWSKNCTYVMTQEMNHLKRDWISFPLILLFFHVIIMFNINYIVVAVRNRFNVMAGFKIVSNFKERTRRKFHSFCKKPNKISTTDNDNVSQIFKEPPPSPPKKDDRNENDPDGVNVENPMLSKVVPTDTNK